MLFLDKLFINPLTSPGEGVTVFTSPYLSAGARALGEAKGLISIKKDEKLLDEILYIPKYKVLNLC